MEANITMRILIHKEPINILFFPLGIPRQQFSTLLHHSLQCKTVIFRFVCNDN